MTLSWILWYGLHLGLTRSEVLFLPLCEIFDLIAIEQIKNEGFTYRDPHESDPDQIHNTLNRLLAYE